MKNHSYPSIIFKGEGVWEAGHSLECAVFGPSPSLRLFPTTCSQSYSSDMRAWWCKCVYFVWPSVLECPPNPNTPRASRAKTAAHAMNQALRRTLHAVQKSLLQPHTLSPWLLRRVKYLEPCLRPIDYFRLCSFDPLSHSVRPVADVRLDHSNSK